METEFLIAVPVLEGLFQKGAHHPEIVIEQGPEPEARIIGVEWRPRTYQIALIYDRPVQEPVLKQLTRAATE